MKKQALLALAAIASLALAVSAAFFDYLPLDVPVSRAVQGLTPTWLEPLMLSASWLGNTASLSVIGLTTAGALALRGRWAYVPAPFILGMMALLVPLLKAAIGRPRPSSDLVDVYLNLETGSFPSGHALMSVCMLGGVYYLADKLVDSPKGVRAIRLAAVAAIAIIGASRVYLGVHWASDVAGGFLMGLLMLFGVIRLIEWRLSRPAGDLRPDGERR